MTFFQSILLGIIQGLTEFLPISSSAHLVLVPYMLGWQIPETQVFVFDVLVQMGTLLAVILYFWKDLLAIITAFVRGLVNRQPFKEPLSRLGWYLILATIPAGLFGLLIKDQVEAAFKSPIATAVFLLFTSMILLIGELFGKRTRPLTSIGWLDALLIGIAQALSVFPGISRSGSTISAGMLRNLDRPSAARFSFLMSIPVMIAAGGLAAVDLMEVPNLVIFLPVVLVGFLAAAVTGYLSIRWLISYLAKRSLVIFSIYCLVLALLVFFSTYVV